MSGNTTHRFSNTALLSVSRVEAPVVISSADLDARLGDVYDRVGLRAGLLERLVGIRERRWWPEDVTFVEGAATAAAKAISESGVDPAEIQLMVNTSIGRLHLEPSTAVAVHDAVGLPPSCQNFDITNACLGFVNGIEIAAAMIDAGLVEYALVVNGEDARGVQEATIARLSAEDVTAKDVVAQFATLTLGSGAVAMVLGRADQHPEGHRVVAAVSRAGTEHHQLCVGDNDLMQTDLKGLLDAGLQLSADLWADAAQEFDWDRGMDRYVIHQISQVHTDALCKRLGIDPDRVPRTFPDRGNIGPVSVPFTLAGEVDDLDEGDRILLMGIGSGLNASCLEIVW
ncbi:MAG: acyl-CoA:acyl-CoA alkyltransferase [Frankiaceae bacterium]|nr:acyl-CoA:acyl-CoA alkyltransferase [Frankiaceae bacterium]